MSLKREEVCAEQMGEDNFPNLAISEQNCGYELSDHVAASYRKTHV